MSILSIQSHVAFGFVGNKAAVFPLQVMGYDVWPVNTVQFSNHTGYGRWTGEVFAREHIRKVIGGIEELGKIDQCEAVLSGYMGSEEICLEVQETVQRFKARNENMLYLCDPVTGGKNCYVKPEVVEFFKTKLQADIITPNQFEAETLSGIGIKNFKDLKDVAEFFHSSGTKIVIITGVKISELKDQLCVFLSYNNEYTYVVKTKEFHFAKPPSGTGDLFSALFLGNYLKTKDHLKALQRTIFFVDHALSNTYKKQSYELDVLNTDYSQCDENLLSKAISLGSKKEHNDKSLAKCS